MNLAIHFKSPTLKRTIIMAVIVISLAAGVAFAIMQSRSVITGNTISTASANLLVSSNGVNYGQTMPGFSFENIIPGGWPAPVGGYSVYLKNTGNTDLDLGLVLDNPPSNPGSADLSKINVGLTDVSGSTAPRGFILESLLNGSQPIEGDLAPGATRHYKLQALAADDATPGTVIGNIDLAFVGTARDPNEPSQ